MVDALVLAGNSFVGQYLCYQLRALDLSVVATSRTPLPGLASCDLTDKSSLESLVNKHQPKWIFQCAGVSHGSRDAMNQVHIDGCNNLLTTVHEFAQEATVLFLGSAAEYGNVTGAHLPISEAHAEQPLSAYGQSKLAQTRRVQALSTELRLKTVVMRPFNLIGPGLPERFLASALIRRLQAILAGTGPDELSLVNGRATRDFVDVRDAVSAMVGIMASPSLQSGTCEVFNIASGVEVSVFELASELSKMAEGVPIHEECEQASVGHIWRSCGSPDKLHSIIGWQPRIDWRQSLSDMWQTDPEAWRHSA